MYEYKNKLTDTVTDKKFNLYYSKTKIHYMRIAHSVWEMSKKRSFISRSVFSGLSEEHLEW